MAERRRRRRCNKRAARCSGVRRRPARRSRLFRDGKRRTYSFSCRRYRCAKSGRRPQQCAPRRPPPPFKGCQRRRATLKPARNDGSAPLLVGCTGGLSFSAITLFLFSAVPLHHVARRRLAFARRPSRKQINALECQESGRRMKGGPRRSLFREARGENALLQWHLLQPLNSPSPRPVTASLICRRGAADRSEQRRLFFHQGRRRTVAENFADTMMRTALRNPGIV